MGWTTMSMSGSVKDWFRSEIEMNGNLEVLEVRIVHRTELYAAVKDKTRGDIFALVYLLRYMPRSYYNFGYKDMDETVGPHYYNCPKTILDKLTPTDSEYAMSWREVCYRKIQNRKSIKTA